jgi:hypothetical protein
VATVLIGMPPSSQASQDAVSQIETLATIEHDNTTAAPPRYRIQAVERVGAILDVFSTEDPELGVTDIAERTGLHKSTAHRFLEHFGLASLYDLPGAQEMKVLLFLPRYRGHEESMAGHLKLHGVREHSMARGFAALKQWLRGILQRGEARRVARVP